MANITDFSRENLRDVVDALRIATVKSEQASPLAQLGATPLALGTDAVSVIRGGLSHSHFSGGEVKPTTPFSLDTSPVVHWTQNIVVPFDKSVFYGSAFESIASSVIAAAAAELPVGIDRAIVTGKDKDGNAITQLEDVAIISQAHDVLVPAPDVARKFAGFSADATGRADGQTGYLISQTLAGELTFDTSNMLQVTPLFPSAASGEVFQTYNGKAIATRFLDGRGVYKNYAPGVNAVAGDWGKVYRAIGSVDVEVFPEAVFGGVSAAENNLVFVRVEAEAAAAVIEPSTFSKWTGDITTEGGGAGDGTGDGTGEVGGA